MCMAYILWRRSFLVGNPFTTDSSLGRGMHTVMWNLSLYAKTLCVSWSLVTHVPIERGSPSKRVCVNCNAKGSDLNDTDNDSYQLIFYEIWRLSLLLVVPIISIHTFRPPGEDLFINSSIVHLSILDTSIHPMKIFNFTAVLQVAVAVWATEIDQSKANDGMLLERGQPQADSNGAAAIVVTVIQTEKVEVHFTETLHTTDVSTKVMHVTEQVQVHVTETLHVTDVSTEVMHVTETQPITETQHVTIHNTVIETLPPVHVTVTESATETLLHTIELAVPVKKLVTQTDLKTVEVRVTETAVKTMTEVQVSHIVQTEILTEEKTETETATEVVNRIETQLATVTKLATETKVIESLKTETATQVIHSVATETKLSTKTKVLESVSTETATQVIHSVAIETQISTATELVTVTQAQIVHSISTETKLATETKAVNSIATETVHSTATVDRVSTEVIQSIATETKLATETQIIHSIATETRLATETKVVSNVTTETVHSIATATAIATVDKILTETVTKVIHSIATETKLATETQVLSTVLTETVASVATETLITETQSAAEFSTIYKVVSITKTVCPTPTGGATHIVIVGGDAGLIYAPSEIIAEVGDIVSFVFMKQNHTVTQSTFGTPCNKMAIDAADSGFLSNTNNTVVPAPVWNYTVASKDPTWWYCAQSTHCRKGMVFAINPTCEKTFKAFQDAAIALNGTLSSPPAAASSTSAAAAAATHNIIVGGEAGLVYTPSEIIAAVGDVVRFVFMKQNHTVTQSTFGAPCNKISAKGIDSGFMSNTNDTITPAPTFDYTVTATEPTWWYCAQTTHCGKGMVFAINPTAEKTFKAFQNAAIALNGTAATTTKAAATELATTTATVVTGTPIPGAACACQCLCPAAAFQIAEIINPPGLPEIPTQIESTMATVVRTGFISAIAPTSILIADPASSIAESLVLDTSILTAADITTVATVTTTALASSLDLTVPLTTATTSGFMTINFSTVSLGDLQREWTGKIGPTPA